MTIRYLAKAIFCTALLTAFTAVGFAQFSAYVQGSVQDPSGAAVPGATLTLKNTQTNVIATAKSDASGNYRFVSLAPGSYQVTADAKGFAPTVIPFTLETNQTYNLPVKLTVGSMTQSVKVTSQAPVLDTADSRNEMTLETQALSTLPLAGRNMISLVTLAPGVEGKGTIAAGSPGSGVDNYSTETQVDASANGQGAVGNMYIVDGLDVTSAIRAGVLNLTPNPDGIQETSIQTNTYNVEYGRASSIQMTMTTKSGTDAYHGNASDYFNDQYLFDRTVFTPKSGYAPFHSDNFSGTIGGPIIPHHQAFFFLAIEPLRAATSTGNQILTFEDPQFTAYAKANYPNTIGTQLLTQYAPSGASNTSVVETAAQVFPGTCGTAATNNIPCSLPMIDQGVYNATSFRNADQWNLRLDKYFKNDRLYGNFYRTTLNTGGPSIRPAFATTSKFYQWSLQVNEAHTFSPNLLNEAIFGVLRVEGILPATGTFSVPVVNVTGQGTGFGDGFALGDFIQENYHWRDVLTKVRGNHTFKFGLEGTFDTELENFQGPHDQPTFQFNNLLALAQDKPYTESGVAYNPLTGKHVEWDWNAAMTTSGLFAEDTWKVRNNVTLTYGLRWDDFGNPYSRSAQTVFANFYYGPGQTIQQQIANGSVIQKNHALNRAVTDIFSPRIGVAWDPTNTGVWVVRGGYGIYHNWPTFANMQEEYRGNPPGPIFPTFYQGTANAPLFVIGDSNTPPFGFTYPTLPARSLNSQGGITGLQFPIGAINPNLKSPVSYAYSASVERQLLHNIVASVGYSGSKDTELLSGGGQVYNVSYGVDINRFRDDLIQNNSLVPTRLNHSFGQIYYTANDRTSAFNAFILDLRGRVGTRGFFNVSYTRSSSMDDTQVYPTATNPHQYYGPSIWNAPNRLSLSWSYQIPGLNQGAGLQGRLTSGWVISGDTILQSGNPYTVFTNAPFLPTVNSAGTFTGYQTNSGDYNADGDNYDYPNVVSYHTATSRKAYLKGLFQGGATGPYASGFSNFPLPAFGQEGNEKYDQFQGPGFAETDAALLKDTHITKTTNLQLRFEFYNLFNRVNLNGVDANLPDGNFGKSVAQFNPRWIQLGANFIF